VRFAAITALSTFLTAQLAPPEVLLAAVQQGGGLLPLLAQCLDEDWYSDVRHTACYVEQLMLQQVRQLLLPPAHSRCCGRSCGSKLSVLALAPLCACAASPLVCICCTYACIL
jgi:hypothetical protein